MALIDKASLLMVPSTYEAGKLYNVLPSGNRAPDSTDQNSGYDQTRADFDFDRGSNAAATRVNASGLIEKYRENEALQSNLFNVSPWSLGNSVLTANATTSPTGESNAAKIESNGINKETRTRQTISGATTGKVYTFSCYMKAGNVSYGIVRHYGISSNGRAWFNLSTGTIGTKDSTLIDAQIESVGDGWYRCSITGKITTSGALDLAPAPNDNDYLSDAAGEYVFLYGAQAESSLVATDYLDSTSVTGKAGVLVDLPRINYDANGENGALLLEPSRANLITQSEYFGAWSANVYDDITPNAETSPEGFDNAYLIETSLNNTGVYIVPSSNISSGDKITTSIFLKAKSGSNSDIISIGMGSTAFAGDRSSRFDLSDGTIDYENPDHDDVDIQPYGNGWYRCIITDTATATGAFAVVMYSYGTDCDWYAYGAMSETGSYATSYIPTMGTSETRAADSCSVTGASDVIGQTEGTLFWDVNLSARDSYTYFALAPNLGSTTAYIGMGITATAFSFEVVNSGVQVAYNYPNSSTGNFKMAFAYKANDFVAYVNGTQVMTDTSGSVPSCSQIGLNAFDKDQPLLYKQAILFNERLSNTELATLTTL